MTKHTRKIDIDTLLMYITETLGQCDFEYVETIANKILTQKIKHYKGVWFTIQDKE